MASEAVIGFVGVVVGSITTAGVNIYRERVVTRRDREARTQQLDRERQMEWWVFQRESLLSLQTALADMVQAVYAELDRMLNEYEATGIWPVRQWATPTAVGWAEAEIRVDMLRVRVFDGDVRSLAQQLRATSRKSVWAGTANEAEQEMECLEGLAERMNARIGEVLEAFY